MWKILMVAVAFSTIVIVVQAQGSCLQCSSSPAHPECIEPDTGNFISACSAANARNNSCFTRVDEHGNVVRGCLGQLDNATASDCDSETCQICSTPGCNSALFPEGRLACHICSGGENTTCSGIVNTTMTICPIYDPEDRCYIARPNGHWERGCLSSAPTRCQTNGTCFLCAAQGCNLGEFNSAINIYSGLTLALIGVVFTMLNK